MDTASSQRPRNDAKKRLESPTEITSEPSKVNLCHHAQQAYFTVARESSTVENRTQRFNGRRQLGDSRLLYDAVGFRTCCNRPAALLLCRFKLEKSTLRIDRLLKPRPGMLAAGVIGTVTSLPKQRSYL